MNANQRLELLLSESRSFFVIDSTGILLHYENFLDELEDPDLYAGLFAAVNTYAKQLNAGDIQSATMEEQKFVFTEDKETGYLIVMNVNSQMTSDNGSWLLDQILDRFKEMQILLKDDIKGSISLETLFSERGKTIDWNTIKAIRGSAIEKQKQSMDKIETLNLSKVNLKNRFWVRIRKMISTMVENQGDLIGVILIIKNRGDLNKLFCGREGFERMGGLYNYIQQKFDEGIVGLELETELIQIGDLFCSIYTLYNAEGGVLALASTSSHLIKRLGNQVERMTSAIERLGTM